MNTRTIAWLTGSLTLLMAVFSFILSFNALADLAAKHQISIPFLFPLVVEAGVIIFSLNALYRSIHGESARWQWTLIIGSSLLAGLFNVLHSTPDVVSRIMAAMPSLFLLLSFETFLGQIKHGVKMSSTIKSLAELMQDIASKNAELQNAIDDKSAELQNIVATKNDEIAKLDFAIADKMQKLNDINAKIDAAKSAKSMILQSGKQQKVGERRQNVLALLHEGYDAKQIAEQLQKDVRTIKGDIVALNGKVSETTK